MVDDPDEGWFVAGLVATFVLCGASAAMFTVMFVVIRIIIGLLR